jgi:hypothetical protein
MAESCHPSVTPDALEKGCKRPVHRCSVTLAPLKKKIPYCAVERNQKETAFLLKEIGIIGIILRNLS